jgi:endogenous inhibitor of DNA gyrase (YacG/DUF329 family)
VSAAVEARATCRGCGAQIEPGTGNRKREWCSDRCRKRTLYSQPCWIAGSRRTGQTAPGRAALPSVRRSEGWRREAIWTRDAILAAIRAWASRVRRATSRTTGGRITRGTTFTTMRAPAGLRTRTGAGRGLTLRSASSAHGTPLSLRRRIRTTTIARWRRERPRVAVTSGTRPSAARPSHAEPESAERSPDPPAGEESP